MHFGTGDYIKSKVLQDLKAGYRTMILKITEILNGNKVILKDFLKHAKYHFSKHIENEIEDLEGFFSIAQKYDELNMWHYDSLEKTLKGMFKHDKKISLIFNEYEDTLTKVLTTIKIIEFIRNKEMEDSLTVGKAKEHFKIHESPYCIQLGMKININIEEQSLEYVQKLWKSLQRRFYLEEATVLLEDIRDACIQIVWRVPKRVCSTIMNKVQSSIDFFVAHHIRIIWIDKQIIYHEDIHHSNNVNLVSIGTHFICSFC